MALTGFWGCRKDVVQGYQPESQTQRRTDPPSVEDAKAWFLSQQSKSPQSFSSNNDSLLVLERIEPVWESIKSDWALTGKGYLLAEVKNSFFNFKGRGGIKLLFSKDTTGSTVGGYLFYMADSLYHKRVGGQYDLKDFTGVFLRFNPNGDFLKGYAVRDGKKSGVVGQIKNLKSYNGLTTRCERTLIYVSDESPTWCDCSAVRAIPLSIDCGGPEGYTPDPFEQPNKQPNCGGVPCYNNNNDNGNNNNSGDTGGATGGGGGNGSIIFVPESALDADQVTITYNSFWHQYEPYGLYTEGEFQDLYYNNPTLFKLLHSLFSRNGFTQSTLALATKFRYLYYPAGITLQEFVEITDNPFIYSQVDAFFNQNGFTRESKTAVQSFVFLMGVDDDFKTLNRNRGNKTIKQLIDEFGFPNLKASTLIGMARANSIDVDNNFTRLGRIQEDAVVRSLGGYKNKKEFKDPTPQNRSAVEPDLLGDGYVEQVEEDQNGRRIINSWKGDQSTFFDSKFVAGNEKVIKDNVSTNANGTAREQLSTMIDVLSQMRGGWINTVRNTLMKPSDHGIAFLVIVTFKDVGIDPNLITQAQNANVHIYKRWLTYSVETNQIEVSTNYEDLTPFIATKKKEAKDPPNFSQPVKIDWTIK